LWQTLIRFEPEKIVPEVALRNTIGFACAVVLGTVLGSPSTGVVAGLGAINVAYSDGRDPYIFRTRRMLISALLSAIAVTAGAISGHSNVTAVVAAALWAFAAGMLVALGTTAADLGVITLVTLVIFAARPLPPLQALGAGAVTLAGGLLQTLLSAFLWPIRRYEPERRIMGEIYGELARLAQAPPPASSAPPMTKLISDAQDSFAPLARDHSVEAERHVFLLTQAERIRLSVLNAGRLQRRIARHEGGAPAAAALARILQLASGAVARIGQRIVAGDTTTAGEPSWSPHSGDLAELRPQALAAGGPSTETPAFFAALLRDARQQVDALRRQIRASESAAAGMRKDSPAAGSGFPSRQPAASEPWRLRFEGWRARLAANMSLDSTVFRHAVRLAICLGLGDAIGRSLSLQRTYWIPMTIAIVLKPDFAATFSRGLLRIAGTLAGLVLATVVFRFVHTGVAADIALLTVFTLLLRLAGPVNYGVFVVAVSGFAVVMIAVTGIPPESVIVPRAINTVLGGALALFAYAVWPTWERTQTSAALADMLDAYRRYFHAVIGAYEGGPLAAIDQVRVVGRRARSNAVASVDRMSGEPGVTLRQVTALNSILVQSHTFVHAVMAMESRLYRERRDAAPPWLGAFAASAEQALEAMAGVLRRSDQASGAGPMRRVRLGETGITGSDGHALIETEGDRIRTSLYSLAEVIARRGWL
jgi:uncharacterized membrane protein YccC